MNFCDFEHVGLPKKNQSPFDPAGRIENSCGAPAQFDKDSAHHR
jgi:hypothetical protein